jgi:hypothetical protein
MHARLGGRVDQSGDNPVAQPQRLEIRFLGTTIRADGIVGIAGAVTLVGFILAIYIQY